MCPEDVRPQHEGADRQHAAPIRLILVVDSAEGARDRRRGHKPPAQDWDVGACGLGWVRGKLPPRYQSSTM